MSDVCMICKAVHPGLTCEEATVQIMARRKAIPKVIPHVRPDIKKVCDLPEGQEVLGMAVFNDNIIVATSNGICRLEGDKLIPILFAPLPDVSEDKND